FVSGLYQASPKWARHERTDSKSGSNGPPTFWTLVKWRRPHLRSKIHLEESSLSASFRFCGEAPDRFRHWGPHPIQITPLDEKMPGTSLSNELSASKAQDTSGRPLERPRRPRASFAA